MPPKQNTSSNANSASQANQAHYAKVSWKQLPDSVTQAAKENIERFVSEIINRHSWNRALIWYVPSPECFQHLKIGIKIGAVHPMQD